jgi:hypothetical protein
VIIVGFYVHDLPYVSELGQKWGSITWRSSYIFYDVNYNIVLFHCLSERGWLVFPFHIDFWMKSILLSMQIWSYVHLKIQMFFVHLSSLLLILCNLWMSWIKLCIHSSQCALHQEDLVLPGSKSSTKTINNF